MVLLSILALLGGIQGIVVLFLILFRFRHPKNTALALLILVFSIRLGTIPTWNTEILLSHRWLWPATTCLPFLFGPLLYWCVRELSRDSPARLPYWPLHLLPFAMGCLLSGGVIGGMSEETYVAFLEKVFQGSPPLGYLILNGLKVALNIVYVVLTICVAFGSRSRGLSQVHRVWLRSLAIIPAIVLVMFIFVALDPDATARLSMGNATPFALLALSMSFLVYGLSFLVLIAPEGLEQGGIPLKKPLSFSMSDEECRKLAEEVCRKLGGGAFKDPELTEAVIARGLGVHPNRVSLAVNRTYRKSFRKLLNQYRISYFTKKVSEGALNRQSILELALDAGFPSKSTFNRVFREEMGITPSEYGKHGQHKR